MIKINEYPYSKEQLEIIMNRKGETLIAIDNKLIITKVNTSKKSTELLKEKTLLDLVRTLNIEDFREFGDDNHLKQVMKDLIVYWTAKNNGGTKERRQLEKVFDIKSRYYTFLRRAKPNIIKPKGKLGRLKKDV